MAEHSDQDDDVLVQTIGHAGFTETEAQLIVAFVPIAFGRPLLEKLGVSQFSSAVSAPTRNGLRVKVLLEDQPVYEGALWLAREHWRSGVLGKQAYEAIATRSAELRAANQALKEGTSVKGSAVASALVGPYAESLVHRSWWSRAWRRLVG